MSKVPKEKTIHALTVVGHGGHSLHNGYDGVYLDGVKLIGGVGKGLNVHTMDKSNLRLVESSAFDTAAPVPETTKGEGPPESMSASDGLLEMLYNNTHFQYIIYRANHILFSQVRLQFFL